MVNPIRILLICTFFIFSATQLVAQTTRPLDHEATNSWHFLTDQKISANGQWALWNEGPKDGDLSLHIRRTRTADLYQFDRAKDAVFSRDSRWVAARLKTALDSVRAYEDADSVNVDSLLLIQLSSGAAETIPDVKSFTFPKEASGVLAVLLNKDKDEPDSLGYEGSTLILKHLSSSAQDTFLTVSDYVFSEDGRWLAFFRPAEDSLINGVYVFDTQSRTEQAVYVGKGKFASLVFDESGMNLAFMGTETTEEDEMDWKLCYLSLDGTQEMRVLVEAGLPGMMDGWEVSEHANLSFSRTGERLFFGTAPAKSPEIDELPSHEQVNVDIWHWEDAILQPQQLKRLKSEQERNYLAVYHLDRQTMIQLADKSMPDVEVADEGESDVAISVTRVPYQIESSWEYPMRRDVWLLDVESGRRENVLTAIQDDVNLSPAGKYVTWWNRDSLAWISMATNGGAMVNLTAGTDVAFYNEIHDWPFAPDAYGSAGWTENDSTFWVYDHYDIWSLDPTAGRPATNITHQFGRNHDLAFRYRKLDPDAHFIIDTQPILLSAFDRVTKSDGFYQFDNQTGDLSTLLMADKSFSWPTKALDDGNIIFTRSDFREFPNLWISDISLSEPEQLSNTNPQQSEFSWGTASLTHWVSLDGDNLDGILYKPDNFDPQKQYPMMVYFYEKKSDGLHRHYTPEPYRSIINISFYVSRGYIVFVPDIPYKIGYPGESAVNAVIPGVTHLISEGFVDPARIGVQGHSWGGYQIAYIVTRSNIFAAAEAGAPVANMTSAYGGIRWGSGMSRMFQYERTQSRIGGTLWEYPLRYLENSPIFTADKIQTPLLMMHNDHDSAVPWYQGIEMFVAMRRLGKPAWLINYNGEPHNLLKWQNKKDWALRMQQFFDYYLLDSQAPEWLINGVPAIKKGQDLGLAPAGGRD